MTIFHTRDNLTVPKDKIVPWAVDWGLRRSTYFVKRPKLKAFFQWNSEKFVRKFKKWNHHYYFPYWFPGIITQINSRQEVERTSEMFMLYFSRGRIVNNSLQTSNLRQGNIKLLVASWAPLRYYLVTQLKFQSPWASGRPLISVPVVKFLLLNK